MPVALPGRSEHAPTDAALGLLAQPARGSSTNLDKSLTVLKPGGLAISVVGPPDAGFAEQLGTPSFLGLAMSVLSRRIRRQGKALGVRYQFFFMQANGSQLRELGALYDSGKLRPVIDSTFPFDRTLEAMAYVEQGRTKAGKVVVSMVPGND
ncbi:zinc-binding dehydrogenase [Streptomyces sp. NPDC102270]|uniref:zinc-binding dehydrogenase n=1 Tax=Streptomyces sp. NPDC102270 TaxID=3366150 RepID=UPI0038028FB3